MRTAPLPALIVVAFTVLVAFVPPVAARHDGAARPHVRGGTKPPSWVLRKPPPATQKQKSAKQRGVNPCLTKDPGFGPYTKWDRAPSVGQMIVPKSFRAGDGEIDVMFHFHGHEPARKEWVQAVTNGVLVGIDFGNGSGPYLKAFESPGRFERLVKSVERGLSKRRGKRARIRRIGVSSWSAGYGAVEQILRTRYGRDRIDTVILLDGLHAGYREKSLDRKKLRPFTEYAQRAARGDALMVVSHSAIVPPRYASAWETANFLIWNVGGTPRPAKTRPTDLMGLELVSTFSKGSFHVRGFAGNDTLDHCAHFGFYRTALQRYVAARWGLSRVTKPTG